MGKEGPRYLLTQADFNYLVEKYHLEPCPFCGSSVGVMHTDHDYKGRRLYDVMCGTPGCYLKDGAEWALPVEELLKRWNNRAGATDER